MDPKPQINRKRTTNPARIVRNGGPWALVPSLVFTPFDFCATELPSEELEFAVNPASNLLLLCNPTTAIFGLQIGHYFYWSASLTFSDLHLLYLYVFELQMTWSFLPAILFQFFQHYYFTTATFPDNVRDNFSG